MYLHDEMQSNRCNFDHFFIHSFANFPMITRIATIGLFLSFAVFRTALGSGDEYRLLADLRNNYDTAERPVYNHSLPVNVKLRILLQQLVDVVCVSSRVMLVSREIF